MYNRDGKVMEWTFELIVPIFDEFIIMHKFRLNVYKQGDYNPVVIRKHFLTR